MSPKGVVFLDIETTGLDVECHEVWDIAVVQPSGGPESFDHAVWYPEPRHLETADSTALHITNFYERTATYEWYWHNDHKYVAREVAAALADKIVVGIVPDFDLRFLTRFLAQYHQAPAWYYQSIDAEVLAAGWLLGRLRTKQDFTVATLPGTRGNFAGLGAWLLPGINEPPLPPWDTATIAKMLGVDPDAPQFVKHTALGDALLARALYEAAMGQNQQAPEVTTLANVTDV